MNAESRPQAAPDQRARRLPGVPDTSVPAIGYVADRRARLLHRAILDARPRTIDDVRRLSAVALWQPHVLDDTIDQLVAESAISEDAYGRLLVRARPR